MVRRLRRRLLRPVEVWERAGEWIVRARAMRAQAQEVRTTVPDPAVMLRRFDHHLRRLLDRARRYAHRVIVVEQPWFEKDYTAEESAHFWQGGVGMPWKETVTVYYSLDVMNRLMRLVNVHAAAVAEQMGIEHVALQRELEPNLDNYYDFGHFTPAGSAIVARTVAQALSPSAAVRVRSRDPLAMAPGAR
jgi:hypothetical protein